MQYAIDLDCNDKGEKLKGKKARLGLPFSKELCVHLTCQMRKKPMSKSLCKIRRPSFLVFGKE